MHRIRTSVGGAAVRSPLRQGGERRQSLLSSLLPPTAAGSSRCLCASGSVRSIVSRPEASVLAPMGEKGWTGAVLDCKAEGKYHEARVRKGRNDGQGRPGEATSTDRAVRLTSEMVFCDTFDDTYGLYIEARDAEAMQGRRPFDKTQYRYIVQAILSRYPVDLFLEHAPIDVPEDDIIPPKLHSMLADIRTWGCESPKLYTMLFHHLGKTFADNLNIAPLAVRIQLKNAVVYLHEQMLDFSERDPDGLNVINVTSMLNAYNHVGLPLHALDVWHRLMLADHEGESVDPTTLSCVFDTCGYAEKLDEARWTMAWLQADESREARLLTKPVWDSYLECLARCMHLREAIDLALHKMAPALQRSQGPRGEPSTSPPHVDAAATTDDSPETVPEDDVEARRRLMASTPNRFAETDEGLPQHSPALGPDIKTFSALLRFAAGLRDRPDNYADPYAWHELRAVIKKDYPDLWPSMRHVGHRITLAVVPHKGWLQRLKELSW